MKKSKSKPKKLKRTPKPKPKPKAKPGPIRDPNDPAYTHRDSSGMGWRMVGSRPVSALADSVMHDCGFPLMT